MSDKPLGTAAAGDSPGLARGFAVVSTDTGHKGTAFDRTYDADQQASLDFAQVAVGRVAELAKQIIAYYYGQPARHSYFAGCSTGGREAMLMTQRYPAEFDGVISGDPAIQAAGFLSESEIPGRRWPFNQIAPNDDSGRPQPNKVFSEGDIKLIVNGILNACDANDGLKDGMVFQHFLEPANSIQMFQPAGGPKNDSCLTSQQTAAIKKAFAGPVNSRGELVHPMNQLMTRASPISCPVSNRVAPTPPAAWRFQRRC